MTVILVTGATGILGRVLVLKLLKKGKTVRATKRNSSDLEEVRRSLQYYTADADLFFNKIQWIDANLNDKRALQKALEDVVEVYHCAAKVSYDPAEQKKVDKINIQGTKNIIECCKYSQVKKFLYVSSAVIFDNGKKGRPIDENSSFIIQTESTVYAASKYKADTVVCNAFNQGLNTIIINPGMIIGSGNWKKSSGEFLQTFINKFYTFSGGSGCVDVRDVAEIAIELMDKNLFGERFLVVSENQKYSNLAQMAREKFHKKRPVILSRKLLNFGKALNILTVGQIPKLRLLTKPNIEFLTSFQKMSNDKVVKALDYKFIPVKESLFFHIDNFLKEKK
ncbi:Nucleoside-diphosphate-sugar epimerase [Chryseobacterium oleae]|uniref:Nucleoside-diphosphate-sugar epimerase n=1 Tax=Chryseobacterium oleae TaxID=491207 RepID=A0A1I4YV56_CHROL|nr:SDR family NAD(P)-dependent oxidoreductase [Chryseobacterium oleae]SFN41905.1 Nucleoside-diphosphate-sugar epimerase [Chryseobacterium oleae]